MRNDFDIIMYRDVFKMHKLTVSEKLLYSYLVGQAVIYECGFKCTYRCIEEIEGYATEEQISLIDGRDHIKIENLEDEPWRRVGTISYAKAAQHISMTRMGAYKAYLGLSDKGLIKEEYIYAPRNIIADGFIRLFTETGLKNELLLFYTWYVNYYNSHGGEEFTTESKLAQFYNTDITKIQWYIRKLTKLGFIRRIPKEERRYGIIVFLKKEL